MIRTQRTHTIGEDVLEQWSRACEKEIVHEPAKIERTRAQTGFFARFFASDEPDSEKNLYSTLNGKNKNQYIITQIKLGEGGCAKVKLGINKKTGEWFAIKIFSYYSGRFSTAAIERGALIAAQNLERVGLLKDRIIIQQRGKTKNVTKDYLIIPFAPGTNLLAVLYPPDANGKKADICFADQLSYARSLVENVQHFHEQGYIICDLKPDNCQLDLSQKIVRTIDSDNIHLANDHEAVYSESTFTGGYVAHEAYDQSLDCCIPTQDTDIFALGATLVDIFSPYDYDLTQKRSPLIGRLWDHGEKYLRVNEGDPKASFLQDPFEKRIWELCKKMTSADIDTRPPVQIALDEINNVQREYLQIKKAPSSPTCRFFVLKKEEEDIAHDLADAMNSTLVSAYSSKNQY